MKVKLDIPYPEVRVEEENSYYADLLSQDYAGGVSETTASLLYSYQHFNTFKDNKEFSEIIEEISITEMTHLELLGKTIKLLGKEPIYKTCNAITEECVMWSATNVNYDDNIKDMLRTNIRGEKAAIKNYSEHKRLIKDKYIKELLSRIILDEKRHIEIFEMLLEKL